MDNNELNNIESDEYLYKNLEETEEVLKNYSSDNDIFKEYTTNEDVTAQYKEKRDKAQTEEEKTNLGVISLVLLGISVALGGFGSNLSYSSGIKNVMESLCSAAGLSSFVLMIYTRIRYRTDIAAKVTMWLFIVGFVTTVCAVLLFIWACTSCVGSMG